MTSAAGPGDADPGAPGIAGDLARWRAYVGRHAAVSADDLDEMEDHLREQVADLSRVGLADSEALLVALTRLGEADAISREFAREHTERLWKQLDVEAAPAAGRREPAVVLALGVAAALCVKAGLSAVSQTRFAMVLSLLVAPFLVGYFAWKRRLSGRAVAAVAAVFVGLAAVAVCYPFDDAADTAVIAAIHMPIVAWLCAGFAYVGGTWRSGPRRMDFIRFTGEFLVYYVLLALGGGALVALTVGSFAAVGVDAGGALAGWVVPLGAAGAVLVAAYLVEAKQQVIENIAPVLARVFLPLMVVMLLALIAAYAAGLAGARPDRTLLIMTDLVLVVVVGLTVYTASARAPGRGAAAVDWLLLILAVTALVADVLMLAATTDRISAFGPSANKITALGVNLLLLVNLAGSAWQLLAVVRGRRPAGVLADWQTRYLPYFGVFAAAVVLIVPPVFAFA